MKKSEYVPSCNTKPGTEAWSRHVAEIKRLEIQATRLHNSAVALTLSMLYLWHKEKQWEKRDADEPRR